MTTLHMKMRTLKMRIIGFLKSIVLLLFLIIVLWV